ncbi:MAG: bifunctional metallophosphatase/5'-nucleotidase [Firmicutes bacterium]|nr:bifunctional metallophosphatase/5'-nucleotidase [Bacillota bacterium]
MGKDAASNAPMAEVGFEDALESASRLVEILKGEDVDLILCLSHSGTAGTSPKTEDEILAREVPGIDVIISGHSHTELKKPLIIGTTIIGSCGQYGQNLGILKITRNTGEGWKLKDYRLKAIDENVPADEKIDGLVDSFKDLVQENYLADFNLVFDQVLAYSPFNFTPPAQIGEEHREEPLANLIGDAYRYAVQSAEGEDYEPIAAALVPSGTIRGSFLAGNLTTADVFIVSSLGIGRDGIPGYPLVSVYLTGRELKTVCEVDASVAPLMSAAQLYLSGLSYSFNPNRLIFNKVMDVHLDHLDGSLEALDDNRLYRVVAGLYSGQMLPVVSAKSWGLLSVVPKDKEGVPIENLEEQIILDRAGGREIKEWYALAQYLESFQPKDGLPVIPAYYSQPQGRKVVNKSLNLFLLLKNPNKFSLLASLTVIILLLALVFLVKKIRRRKRQVLRRY